MSTPQVTHQEVESWLWESSSTLRGPVDAANLRDFVFPLLFLKRLSDKSDEEQDKAVAKFSKDLDERQLVYLIIDGSVEDAQSPTKRKRAGIQVEGKCYTANQSDVTSQTMTANVRNTLQ